MSLPKSIRLSSNNRTLHISFQPALIYPNEPGIIAVCAIPRLSPSHLNHTAPLHLVPPHIVDIIPKQKPRIPRNVHSVHLRWVTVC